MPGIYLQPWGEPRTSLNPAVAELERFFLAYRIYINWSRLRLPVITIQAAGRKGGSQSWHVSRRWQQVPGKPAAQAGKPSAGLSAEEASPVYDELNICPECFRQGVEAIGHEMIRAMAHYANACEGKRDVNVNGYHTSAFKIRAEEFGLRCTCARHRRFGWCETELTAQARQRIAEIHLDERAFLLCRTPAAGDRGRPAAVRRARVLWQCDCAEGPDVALFAGEELQARCQKCQAEYRVQGAGRKK
jgi:hypothetical protein